MLSVKKSVPGSRRAVPGNVLSLVLTLFFFGCSQRNETSPPSRTITVSIGDFIWPETRDKHAEAEIDNSYVEIRMSGEIKRGDILDEHSHWQGFTYSFFVRRGASGILINPKSTGDIFGKPIGYAWISGDFSRIKIEFYTVESSPRGNSSPPAGLRPQPFNGEYELIHVK